jgi:hypothetical protein
MFRLTPARSRIRRAAGVAAATLTVAAVAAACGSSSSSSSSSGSAASSSAGSANVAAAQQLVAQAMQRPSTITVAKPVGRAVPTGKKLVYVSCGISDCCSTDAVAAPFIYNTSTPSQAAVGGKYLAAEVVADSKGKANTLYVNIPAFTILSSLGAEFKNSYKQYCPTCGYDSIDVSLTQLPKAPNLIVSYLRSHPSVNYVALSVANQLDAGLPAALSAAGLSHVKIVGQGGGPTDFQYVANGQELALLPFDYYNVDYQMVDALARHFAGAPVELTPPPQWLVTKANLPSSHSNLFPDVTGYQSQFLKLWGKA